MNETIISPSILSSDFSVLGQEIKCVKDAGAKWIHIDVMDGHFVPNITIGVPVVKSIKKCTDLVLDTHLMIENPQKYAEVFAHAGSDIITFHYEACTSDRDIKNVIEKIKFCGARAGISIKPKTAPEVLYPFLDDVDVVLIMTVEPGFGGQEFMHDCALKIPRIKEKASENLIIQVDGGINNITAKICKSLGATSLVAGSYIYNSNNYEKAIKELL